MVARWRFQRALRALKKLHVSVRGPLNTPGKNHIYVVENCMLTESEIIASHTDGKLTVDNFPSFLVEFRHLQHTTQPSKRIDLRNRRRSERVLLQVAVIVVVEMEKGRHFRTQAFTQVVNAHGGVLGAPLQMATDKRFKLVSPQSGKEVGCRIVHVGEPLDGCFPTAFEFEQPNPQFWPIAISPSDWALVGGFQSTR